MPMIDVYAATGTFADEHQLAVDLASAVMKVEQVPDKQLAVVAQLTAIVADAAGDPSLAGRTRVLLTEAPDGGWGLAGHASTNQELVQAARAQLASGPVQTGN